MDHVDLEFEREPIRKGGKGKRGLRRRKEGFLGCWDVTDSIEMCLLYFFFFSPLLTHSDQCHHGFSSGA